MEFQFLRLISVLFQVGTEGRPTPAFILLVKIFTLRPTKRQVQPERTVFLGNAFAVLCGTLPTYRMFAPATNLNIGKRYKEKV